MISFRRLDGVKLLSGSDFEVGQRCVYISSES